MPERGRPQREPRHATRAAARRSDYLAALAKRRGDGDIEGRRAPRGSAVVSGRAALVRDDLDATRRPRARHHLLHAVPLDGGPERRGAQTDVSELERTKAALETSLREVGELKDRLEAENVMLHREVRHEHGFESIVGCSAAFGRVLSPDRAGGADRRDRAAARRDRHRQGAGRPGAARPQPAARAAVRHRQLRGAAGRRSIESELFGHERGAFTGALAAHESAASSSPTAARSSSTRSARLPPALQAKLLRVLQERRVRARSAAPRTIAGRRAHHRRDQPRPRARDARGHASATTSTTACSVFPITLPPLRERREDIPLLVWHFLARQQSRIGRGDQAASPTP